jgi:hypothetical protein
VVVEINIINVLIISGCITYRSLELYKKRLISFTFIYDCCNCQQLTTLHPTAGLPLKLSSVGPGQFLGGRPDAAESGVGGPGECIFSSSLKKQYPNAPGPVIGDIDLFRVPSFGWDIKWVS